MQIQEIRDDLAKVTHASQLNKTLSMLLTYLEEREPAERGSLEADAADSEESDMYSEQVHQRLAGITELDELDQLIDEVSGTEADDEEFRTAAAQRRSVLQSKAQASDGSSAAADYRASNKAELQAEAERRGLATGGTKEDLVARLVEDDAKPKQ